MHGGYRDFLVQGEELLGTLGNGNFQIRFRGPIRPGLSFSLLYLPLRIKVHSQVSLCVTAAVFCAPRLSTLPSPFSLIGSSRTNWFWASRARVGTRRTSPPPVQGTARGGQAPNRSRTHDPQQARPALRRAGLAAQQFQVSQRERPGSHRAVARTNNNKRRCCWILFLRARSLC